MRRTTASAVAREKNGTNDVFSFFNTFFSRRRQTKTLNASSSSSFTHGERREKKGGRLKKQLLLFVFLFLLLVVLLVVLLLLLLLSFSFFLLPLPPPEGQDVRHPTRDAALHRARRGPHAAFGLVARQNNPDPGLPVDQGTHERDQESSDRSPRERRERDGGDGRREQGGRQRCDDSV